MLMQGPTESLSALQQSMLQCWWIGHAAKRQTTSFQVLARGRLQQCSQQTRRKSLGAWIDDLLNQDLRAGNQFRFQPRLWFQ